MSALSELIVEANTGGLTARAFARRARELGSDLGPDTAWKLLSGRHGTPSEATLEAVHAVFPSLKMTDLRAAASVPAGEAERWEPPPESSRLNRHQRKALDDLIRTIVAPAEDAPSAVTQLRAADRSDGDNPRPGGRKRRK